jgi:glycine cleavage system H protein
MAAYPSEYRYTKEHEWIQADGASGTVGITHHAQEKLGDIVFVELPAVGRKLAAMESFGTVESVKAVSDLYCPAAGTVTEVNSRLAEKPELLNQDPHAGAWLIKIKLDNPKELDALLTAPQYQQFIAAEDSGA